MSDRTYLYVRAQTPHLNHGRKSVPLVQQGGAETEHEPVVVSFVVDKDHPLAEVLQADAEFTVELVERPEQTYSEHVAEALAAHRNLTQRYLVDLPIRDELIERLAVAEELISESERAMEAEYKRRCEEREVQFSSKPADPREDFGAFEVLAHDVLNDLDDVEVEPGSESERILESLQVKAAHLGAKSTKLEEQGE